jgi:hypothetical protein
MMHVLARLFVILLLTSALSLYAEREPYVLFIHAGPKVSDQLVTEIATDLGSGLN